MCDCMHMRSEKVQYGKRNTMMLFDVHDRNVSTQCSSNEVDDDDEE